MDPESHILRSWSTNADPWTRAIVEQRIESRRLVVTHSTAATTFPALDGRTVVIADAAAGGTPLRSFIYTDR